MEDNIRVKYPNLHKYLFTVTTSSKLLAMFLFIALPFVGFYLGMMYEEKIKAISPNAISKINNNIQNIVPTNIPTVTSNPLTETSYWKTYEDNAQGFSIKYPQNLEVTKDSSESFWSDWKTKESIKGDLLILNYARNGYGFSMDILSYANTQKLTTEQIIQRRLDYLTNASKNEVITKYTMKTKASYLNELNSRTTYNNGEINGIKIIQVSSSGDDFIRILYATKNTIYEITIEGSWESETDYKNGDKLINLILSTFKVIN